MNKGTKYFVLLWMSMASISAFSQLPSGIIWDKAVGCQEATHEHGFDVEGEGECIKVCENSEVTYTLVGGDPQDWLNVHWNITGGNLIGSSGTDATVNWGSQGWGNILAEIETEEGTFIREVCVEIIPGPRALFNIAPNMQPPSGSIEVCRGEAVYFQNLSMPNGGSPLVSYSWHFSDDNTTSADFEPVHVFQNSGTYTVELTVTNACNCSASIKTRVQVKGAGLQIQCNSIICENAVETYTVNRISNPGNPLGCQDYNWMVEGGQILSQNGQSVDVQWNNVDEDGFGYVTFYPGSCNVECTSPVTIKVPVISNEVGIDGPMKICEGEQFRYSIPQWPSTEVSWEVVQSSGYMFFGSDQPNETIFRGNNPGHYLLKATYTNTLMGCGGIAYKEIEVIPNVSIQGPARLCEGENGQFSAGGSYVSWRLEGPSGVQTGNGYDYTYTFPLPGAYTLSLGTGDYCLDKVHSIYVTALPQAPTGIDGPLEACLNQQVSYSVTGTNEGTTYWAVENGVIAGANSGEQVNVIFDSSASGPYVVKAWNERNGCASEITQITVSPLIVDFAVSGAQTVCSSNYEIYSVDYADGDKYTWTVTPNYLGSVVTTPQEDEVEILWNNVSAPTVAAIKVEIEKCGGIHTEIYPVTVQNAPPLSITAPSSVCRGEQVNFGISGLTSWDSITWDFGDGATATDTESPSHQYTDLNANNVNYTVTLTVEGANGCVNDATASFNIQVMPAPVASLSPAVTAAYCSQAELNNNPPTFTLTVDSNYAAATDIDWYHDGNPMSVPPLTYSITPNDFGSYHAMVSSANGCSAPTNIVRVRQDDCGSSTGSCTPNASITALSAQLDGCQIGSASVSYTGTPIDHEWQVSGIASISNETMSTANFSFGQAGNYVIKYIATYNGVDDNGDPCIVSLSRSTELVVPYEAILLYSVDCGSAGAYDLTLYDASDYFPGISNQNLNLDFMVDGVSHGPGTNGELNVSLPPGPHTLELEISSPGYASCTATLPIDLPNMPTVQINAPAAACVGMPVPFSATVSTPGIVDYEWDFGDVAENSLPGPERVYSEPGTYNVLLIVTNIYSCQTTVTYPIQIEENNMDGQLELTPPTACSGEPITITYNDMGTTLVDTFYWIHEQDTVQTNVNHLTVTEPGEYILAGESAGGCFNPNIANVQVTYLETPLTRITGPVEVCAEDTFQLNALPARDNYDYTWKRDGQVLSEWDDEPVMDQTIDQPGSYDYEVTITAPSGCSDTNTFTVNVYPNPVDPSVNMQILSCDPYTVELSATHPDPGTFVWSDGQAGPTIEVNQGGPYRVIFFNQYGCSSSYELDVPPNPGAYIWVHPKGCYDTCKRSSSSSYLSGPSLPFQYWEWQINGSSINSGTGMVPDQTFIGNGVYTLTLDNGQCSITSEGMKWEIVPQGCRECDLNFQIMGIQVQHDMYGNCYYIISIGFMNPGPPMTYTLSNQSNNGTIIPAGGTLPNGGSSHQFEFYPNAGFSGGMVNLRLLAEILHQPVTCFFDFSVNLTSCSPAPRPDGEKTGSNAMGDSGLSVSPNPTKGNLIVNYQLEAFGKGNYSLHIYDLQGRPVMEKEIQDISGNWNVELNGQANGMYLLVLRKNGEVSGYQRVILDK